MNYNKLILRGVNVSGERAEKRLKHTSSVPFIPKEHITLIKKGNKERAGNCLKKNNYNYLSSKNLKVHEVKALEPDALTSTNFFVESMKGIFQDTVPPKLTKEQRKSNLRLKKIKHFTSKLQDLYVKPIKSSSINLYICF